MPEAFLALSPAERRDALEFAASESGRPVHLLEKDVWVVWTLAVLFESSFGGSLVFKGGTSLSKAYRAIRRFSEDIGLTYDIRKLIPDLIGDRGDALPPTSSQESKWTRQVRKRLPEWIDGAVVPELRRAAETEDQRVELRHENDILHVDYKAVASGSTYVRPSVTLEFGARSTGEPWEVRGVNCDAAQYLTQLEFPEASPRGMRVERTFWEKATAVHAYCLKGRLAGDRISRHWHDLVRLDDAGYADSAIRDPGLGRDVARHKALFFAEKGADGQPVDYGAAVQGAIRLVPDGSAAKALADDYEQMVEAGLLLEDVEPFEALMQGCRRLESKINGSGSPNLR